MFHALEWNFEKQLYLDPQLIFWQVNLKASNRSLRCVFKKVIFSWENVFSSKCWTQISKKEGREGGREGGRKKEKKKGKKSLGEIVFLQGLWLMT